MDFENATLAQLGRWMTARTGDMRPARVAQSSAPQLRYDFTMTNIARDPGKRANFTTPELLALCERIEDPAKRRAAMLAAGLLPVPEGVNDGPH